MRSLKVLLLCVVVSVLGCSSTKDPSKDSVGFEIIPKKEGYTIQVKNPWNSGTFLSQLTVAQPYKRIICTSATHIGFLKALNKMDCIVGVCNRNLIYTPLSDSMVDVGDSMQPDLEKIVHLQPDIVLLVAYSPNDVVANQLQKMNIPFLYINEWMENEPLMRTQWIRVFGALTNSLATADSVYAEVCHDYDSIRTLACEAKDTTWIMSGQDFRGTWYVPSGNSYMSHLFADAGFHYVYAEKQTDNSSLPLKFEQVLLDFQHADVWVGCSANSLEELQNINPKHSLFKAYQEKRVYNFYRRTTPYGANDFWENGVVHPEKLLQDLYAIRTNDSSSTFTLHLPD